jgi:hypothetical protein
MSPRPALVASFARSEQLLAALRQLRAAGFTLVEAYTPHPLPGLDELVPQRPTPIGWIAAAAAAGGGTGAYFLQWFATHDLPENVGGRPLNSWPAFVPVTFELAVLTAAVVGVLTLCLLCGLPRLDHPMFAVRGFAHASQDRFFIRVDSDDPRYESGHPREVLAALKPESLQEVLA